MYQDKMLAAFKNALLTSNSASSNSNVTQQQSQQQPVGITIQAQNHVAVTLTQGDILNCNAEVLVNTTGGNFDLVAAGLITVLLAHAHCTLSVFKLHGL